MIIVAVATVAFIAGLYYAWYWDNKAFEKYKKRVEELERRFKNLDL